MANCSLFASLAIPQGSNKRTSMLLLRLTIQFWCPSIKKMSIFAGERGDGRSRITKNPLRIVKMSDRNTDTVPVSMNFATAQKGFFREDISHIKGFFNPVKTAVIETKHKFEWLVSKTTILEITYRTSIWDSPYSDSFRSTQDTLLENCSSKVQIIRPITQEYVTVFGLCYAPIRLEDLRT